MQKSGWVQERRLIWMYCQLNLLPKEAPKGTQDVSSGLSVVVGACFPMVWDTARIRPLKPATPVLTFVSFPISQTLSFQADKKAANQCLARLPQ